MTAAPDPLATADALEWFARAWDERKQYPLTIDEREAIEWSAQILREAADREQPDAKSNDQERL